MPHMQTVPAALRTKANGIAEAMGHGPNCFSIPMSATGNEPVTHYGFHSWIDVEGMDATGLPGVPQHRKDAIKQGDFTAFTAGRQQNKPAQSNGRGDFDDWASGQGLQVVTDNL